MKRNSLIASVIIGTGSLLAISQVEANDKVRANEVIEQSARARMGDSNVALTADDQQEIKTVLYKFLDSAFENDLEDMIDNLSKADRERLDKQRSAMAESKVEGNELENAWEAAYDTSFEDGLEIAKIPVTIEPIAVVEGKPRTAQVSLVGRNGEKTAIVTLVDEGAIKTTWRIDAPDSLSAAQLNESLQKIQLTLRNDIKAQSNVGASYQQFANRVFRAASDL